MVHHRKLGLQYLLRHHKHWRNDGSMANLPNGTETEDTSACAKDRASERCACWTALVPHLWLETAVLITSS